MLRSAAGKVMWLGKATVFLVGLAVVLALVFGAAAAALGADGRPFILGQKNTASKVSQLVRSGVGPALRLQVDSGPPMAVNSRTKVNNLNADRIDSLDSTELVQGRVSISGSTAQRFSAIVQHFEGFGNYGVGFRRVVTAPEKANPVNMSITCTNNTTVGTLRIENTGAFGDSQFLWIDDGSANPSFTTLSAGNFIDRSVPVTGDHLTIRITDVFNPIRMTTIDMFTRHGNTGCDVNSHAIYTFAQ